PFAAPPWAFRFPTCESFGPGRHPRLPTTPEIDYQWNIELGGRRDTYADAEEIRDDLLRVIHGLWDHTKNHCARDKEKAAHCRLVWVGHVAGKRENRRLIGDYVLTQNDIARQTLFPDRVAFGAWSVDDHYSAGFFHDGPTGRHMDAERDHHYQGVPFSIPFRCLYSRNIENLMMAGRDISASHLALSNTRVMLTCAILGHATGTAAALCTAKGTTPRGLYQDHIEELQQELLKQGAAVFEMPNTDPRDLARRAAVRASSERAHESGDLMAAGNVINGHARAVGMRGRETTNAWGADPDAPSPHWIELEWEEPTRLNVVHVSFQTVDLAPRRFALEAWRDGAWRRVLELTDNRHRRHVLGLDSIRTRRLRVVLQEPAAICEIRVYDEPQRVVEIARRAHANMRLPDEGPWLPWAREAPAEKLDGIVMDDPQAERTGEWVHSTWAESFIGYGYLHDDDSGKGARSLTFRPEVTEPGTYEVRIAYSAYGNRATNTPVTIHAATGATTVHIDQRQPPPIDGTFLSLGTFALDDRSRIVITNADTDGHVVVDALQLLAVAPSPPRETADRTPMS
ncbi:MAG: FAD-dependent oxidoreductase, partial [Armatimonadota bacterium]